MTALLGSAGVGLGLAASLAGIGTLLLGLKSNRPSLVRQGRWYAALVLLGAVLAVIAMQVALLTNNFSLEYIANNSASTTPLGFKIASMWASLEGSILLWSLILSGYISAVAYRFRDRVSDPMVTWALITMFVVSAFFFLMMFGPADPFRTLMTAPLEGRGPNPLLQNHPLMWFHPPLLYVGYVGFTVPFAFAIAALVTGRVGEGWMLETRRWTLVAWGFLTTGIIVGGWWAYAVLGWGGYWGWDPVENASLLPWLTGTAFLHSVVVQEKRGMLRVWNLSLIIATFALTILGTFLTRSGVIGSVHAFGDSGVGVWLLAFLGLILVVSLALLAWRGDALRSQNGIASPFSRESSFLVNNLLFSAFAFMVLLGTLYPLIVELLNDQRLTVGPPYFDRFTVPLGFMLLFLMAVAPLLPWGAKNNQAVAKRLTFPAWGGLGAAVLSLLLGAEGFTPVLAFGLAGMAAASAGRTIFRAVRKHGFRGFTGRTNGGMVVHLGVVVVAVAIAASGSFATEGTFTMQVGDTAEVNGHVVQFVGVSEQDKPAYIQQSSLVTIDGEGGYVAGFQQYKVSGTSVAVPAIRTSPTEDVFIVLERSYAESTEDIVLRIVVTPLIMWLWIGGLILAVGVFLCILSGPREASQRPTVAADHEADAEGATRAEQSTDSSQYVSADR
ncbi:MAG: heme lyase CcmF/NrfE family subunit [Acidimicrobiales bacterium]